MTVEEFRKHKFLPSQWRRELATNGILQAVLQLMEETHPARMAIRGDNNEDVSPTRASIELGMTRGYSLFADRLRVLAVPIVHAADVGPPTYQKPQETPTT
jgi:hypothetical protein